MLYQIGLVLILVFIALIIAKRLKKTDADNDQLVYEDDMTDEELKKLDESEQIVSIISQKDFKPKAFKISITHYKENRQIITLSDIADISLALKDSDPVVHFNGKPAIVLEISKRLGANMIKVSEKVRKELPGVATGFIRGEKWNIFRMFVKAFILKEN